MSNSGRSTLGRIVLWSVLVTVSASTTLAGPSKSRFKYDEEGKKALNEWVSSYKKGREDYRTSVEEGFKKVEEFFVTEEKGKNK